MELLPLLWVLGFALKEFGDVNRYVVFTWHWIEDLSRPEGARLADSAATVALLLILASSFLLVRRAWRYGLLILVSIACSVVIIIDSLHANYFGVLPSIAETVEMRQLLEVTRSISDLFSPYYVVLFLDSIVMLLLWPTYRRICRNSQPVAFRRRSAFASLLVLLGLVVLLPTAYRARETQAFQNADRLRQFGATVGVLPYHATDLLASAAPEVRVTEVAYARVRRFLETRAAQAAEPSPLYGVAKGKSLILISAESLMAYMVGLEIDGLPVMPRFTKFVEESIRFSNFHEQAWLGNTSDADFLVMQSLYPLPMGPVATHHFENDFYGLPKVLAKAGYSNFSANGAPSWMWRRETMHKALGFERSYFKSAFQAKDRIYGWITDKDFFEQSIDKMAPLPRPFMAYLLSASNHHPFDIPKKFRTFPAGKYEGTPLGLYIQTTNYFDTAFGALLDGLEAAGLLDQVVIAVFSDHRAYLGEAGAQVPELLGYSSDNHYRRLRARKVLPFVVRLPGARHAGVNPTFGGQIDVMPTLLGLLGITSTPTTMLGRDLTADGEELVIFRDGSFTDGQVYLINRYGPISNASCFAVATERPVDCTPLADKRRQAQERLEISDLIIRGDLMPRLEADLSGPNSRAGG